MKKIALLLFMLPVLHACKKDKPEPLLPLAPPVPLIYNGYTYKTVRIGTQVWMAENLRTTKYSNGTDIIPITLVSANTWLNNTTGAYCDYDYNASNATIYGHLYNWYAVANTNSNKIAPDGWHVPTKEEFETLRAYLGTPGVDNSKISNVLREKGTVNWATNDGATNSSGFTALPSGVNTNNTFAGLKNFCFFVSATSLSNENTSAFSISSSNSYTSNIKKSYGYSVRLIKDPK